MSLDQLFLSGCFYILPPILFEYADFRSAVCVLYRFIYRTYDAY